MVDGSPFHPKHSYLKQSKGPWKYIVKQSNVIGKEKQHLFGKTVGWCVLCHKYCESLMHFLVFHEYAQFFWNRFLSTFNYHMAFLNTPSILLHMLLVGHRFKKDKEILWTFHHQSLFVVHLDWAESSHL